MGGAPVNITLKLTGAAQIKREAEQAARDLQAIFQKYGGQDVGGLAGRMFAGGGQTPQGRASLRLAQFRAPDTIAAYAASQGLNQAQMQNELRAYQTRLAGLSAVGGILPRGEQETAGSGLGTLARFGTSFARGLLGVTAIAAPGYAAAKLMQRFNDMAVNEGLQISQLRRLAPPGMTRDQLFHLGATGGNSAYMDPAQFTQFLGGIGAQAGARGTGIASMAAQMTRQFGLSPEQGAGFFGAEARLGVDNPAALKKLADAIADAVQRGRMRGLEGETLSALAESTSKLAQRVVGPEAVYQGANLATLDLAGRLQALGPAFFGGGGIQTMANVQQNINSRSLFNMPDLVKPFLMNEMNKARTMTVPGFGKIDLTTPEGMEKAKQFLTTTPDGQKILGNMLVSARTSGGSFTEYSLAQQLGLQTMLGGYGPLEGMLGGTSASMTKGVADAYKKYSQQQSDAEKQVAEQAKMYSQLTLAGERLAPIFLKLATYGADAAAVLHRLIASYIPTIWDKLEKRFGDIAMGGAGDWGGILPGISPGSLMPSIPAPGDISGVGDVVPDLKAIFGGGVPGAVAGAASRIYKGPGGFSGTGMDPRKAAIMRALIMAESSGKAGAINKGHYGLGQIAPATAHGLNVYYKGRYVPSIPTDELKQMLLDPDFNLAMTSAYMDQIAAGGVGWDNPEGMVAAWHDGPHHKGPITAAAAAEIRNFRTFYNPGSVGLGPFGGGSPPASMPSATDLYTTIRDAIKEGFEDAFGAPDFDKKFHHPAPPVVVHVHPSHPAAPRATSKAVMATPRAVPTPAPRH